jgi:hypothetical protein
MRAKLADVPAVAAADDSDFAAAAAAYFLQTCLSLC